MIDMDEMARIDRSEYLRNLMERLRTKMPSKEVWDRLIEKRDRKYEVKRMVNLAERGFFDG